MSENQKQENLTPDEEASTIFSAPTEKNRVEQKKKKALPRIIASVLAVAILITGTVAVIKLIPEMEEEEAPQVEEITVKELESDDISKVLVTDSEKETEIYSKTVEEDDSETVEWYVKGIDTSLTDSYMVSNVVSAVTEIKATRKITEKTAEECGLEKPDITAVVTPKKGDKYTVYLGAKSPDNSGYYLKLSSGEDIYLVSDEVYEELAFELVDFAATANITGFNNDDGDLNDYFTDSTLSRFDSLSLKGKNHPQGLEFIYKEDIATFGYYITSPVKRISKNTDAVFALYRDGITVDGAYSYDKSSEALKKFGLDNPTLESVMRVGKQSITYKFALQEDGNYAVVSDTGKMIYRVSAETLTGVADLETTDFYSGWILSTSINDMKNFTIEAPNKTYSFDVKTVTVKDEEDDSESTEYKVKCNGKDIVAKNFQNLYQYCLSVHCTDFTVDKLNPDEMITIKTTLNDGSVTKAEYIKAGASKHQCSVDGSALGKVNTSSLDKILKYAEKVANGETIGEIV